MLTSGERERERERERESEGEKIDEEKVEYPKLLHKRRTQNFGILLHKSEQLIEILPI